MKTDQDHLRHLPTWAEIEARFLEMFPQGLNPTATYTVEQLTSEARAAHRRQAERRAAAAAASTPTPAPATRAKPLTKAELIGKAAMASGQAKVLRKSPVKSFTATKAQ